MNIDILIPTCKNLHDLDFQIKEIQQFVNTDYRIITTGFPLSAALNRNFCHMHTESEYVIMLDDDVTGFFENWEQILIQPLKDNPNIRLTSARYLKTDGITPAHMMAGNYDLDTPLIQVNKCPTACFAYRKRDLDSLVNFHNQSSLPFDEMFIGSGWEDDALCFDLKHRFGNECTFVIINECKLIHINEMKNQHTGNNFQANKQYYLDSGRLVL